VSLDNPPVSTQPGDITTIIDYVTYINWILTDDVGAGYYRVSINGTPGVWNTWTSGISVNYPINTSMTGTFEYIIEFNDSNNQWGVPDTVIVVINEPPPFPTGETQINLTCFLNGTEQVDENGFLLPVQGWNSTFTDIAVSNVSLYDFHYLLEEDYEIVFEGFRYPVHTQRWVMSFNITDSCIVDAIDFVFSTDLSILFPDSVRIIYTDIIIYNATYSVGKGKPEPDQVIYNETEWGGLDMTVWPFMEWVSASSAPYWNGSLAVKPTLAIENTFGNTFFISFSTNRSLYWYYSNDGSDPEGDQGHVYYQGFADEWYDIPTPTDCTLRLNLKALKNQTKPSEINMTINNELVTDLGTWNSTTLLIPEPSGSIPFNISSTWYNISFQVNWTSQILEIGTAITSYNAEPMNPIVEWNVTIPAIFATGSYNKRINVTIPTTWNSTNVYYNSVEHSSSSWEEIINSKYVIISDADNGMWVVTCEGYNWISNLTISKTEIYTFDMVNISARLIRPVFDSGNDTARLYVMDPYQQILDDTISGKGVGDFINITWNVAQSIHQNGVYLLTVSWFNGTEAGIWNTSIQVYNSTEIVIVSPDHRGTIIEMAKGQIFNLTVFYNMSFWTGSSWGTLYLNKTMGANVTYTFQGSAPQAMLNTSVGGKWAWTTTITSPNTHGTYPIYINATAWSDIQNYTNYLITLQVKQYGTNLIFNDTAKETFWNTPIPFSFTYTNLTGHSIVTDNITIDWKYDYDLGYRGVLQEGVNYSVTYDGGTEEYTIIFANFSAYIYKLLFHIEGDVYQSQRAYLTLIFNNKTTSLNNQTIIPRATYQDDGVVNVTVYYKDLVDDIGILGGTIQSNWSIIKDYVVQELGGGYYNISLNISKVALNNYSILISASKNNYETANLIIHLEIYGYATNILSLFAENLTGTYAIIYAKENWTVTFEFVNASDGAGIGGATISASFGGESCIWQNIVGGNYTVWADSNKLASPMAGQNYTLDIRIGKAFYGDQRITITVNITKLPSQLYPLESMINAEIDDFVEVRVQLNDTYNLQPINGMVWYELQGDRQQMLPTGTAGEYYTIINLTDYISGEYQINFDSWAMDYQNASEIMMLNVSRLNIVIITESGTVSGYINESLDFSIQLKDSKNRIVENLAVTYEITPGSITGSFIYDENGFYNTTIDLTGLSASLFSLRINSSLTAKYNKSISNLNLEVNKIPTLIISPDMNITAYYGEQYLLSVNYLDTYHNSLIENENLQYEIVGEIPPTDLGHVGLGSYQALINLTGITIGDYTLVIRSNAASPNYEYTNLLIEFHIVSKIQTELAIYLPEEIEVGELLDVTFKLQTNDSTPIPNQWISYSINTNFHNGSDSLFQQDLFTNTSGMGFIQYLVLEGANHIDISSYFAGTNNLTDVWNSTLIFVASISYNLTIRVPSSVTVGDNLLIQADLSNSTHPIGNALINFTIFVVFSEDVTEIHYMNGSTDGNGTASITFRAPEESISIYILASYEAEDGKVTYSEPAIVVSFDPWQALLEKWALPILIIVAVAILALLGYYSFSRLRRRFMSIEDKKRALIQRRAENRREITIITQEIQETRSETLKEAEIASGKMDFEKAGKLYEKAGNLTLELADKSVAREFFLKAKEMQKYGTQKSRQKDLEEQKERLLDKARGAIRERDIVEASRNYRQVAEISRMLGERDQAAKFLKLADAAHERIEALKQGDLRKKSGVYLSKADKAMAKQNFITAAENFEEAAKIMLLIGDDEGIKRFTGWAKLARERDSLASEKSKEEWEDEMVETQKSLILKAKGLVREKDYERAVDVYSLLTIYALELGNLASVKKFKRDIEFCRKQLSMKEISPEVRSLMLERKKLLVNVEDATNNNRYAVVARYYKRIATISESIEGKEVARTYMKQANYYLNKAKEKRFAEKVEVEEDKFVKKPVKPIAKVSKDELEETKAELAVTVKNARGALKTGKSVLARELYERASVLAAMIDDKESEHRYRVKAEEIELLKPKKRVANEAVVRKNIAELMQKAEKSLNKKKYTDAKNYYEEISELFIQIGEEDAANEFIERANSVRRLIKK
ncbi:MAG: hypothetical protein HWN66_12120, partial [Candidatus Helarchaeota archaeon]|nr:hypothetical protein [Candidatus Helarchaeota archaeon]